VGCSAGGSDERIVAILLQVGVFFSSESDKAFWTVLLMQSTFVGFQILTAVLMKTFAFWGITACNPLKFN
jgi:hypothetical protein